MVNAYLLEERGQQSEGASGLSKDLFRPSPGSAVRPHATPETSVDDDGRGRFATVAVVLIAIGVLAGGAFVIWWWWSAGAETSPQTGAPVEQTTDATDAEVPEPFPTTSESESRDVTADESAAASVAAPPAPGRVEPEPPAKDREEPAAVSPAARVPEVRLVLRRPTQGRVNCDNRRVEILDGLAEGTGMVFRCREFLLVDALDGGAVLVQPEGSEGTPLGPDGLPVVGRYVVPAKPRSGGGEP
jgi:hypothetical protein